MDYHLLGRSGLRISPLTLGTMNFGTRGYHAPYGKAPEDAAAILRRYLELGGNVVDTADFYTAGHSEEIIGDVLAQSRRRDSVVLTTKVGISTDQADPNAGGNGRKHIITAVEDSLRRLRTDHIDLYLLHVWDRITPAEEVVHTFDDLLSAGKIRYAGLSDVPAWYAARAQTYAEAHHLTPMIALQLPYSLLSRDIELEYVPLGRQLGLGISGYGPVAAGVLSGKYRRAGHTITGEGRLGTLGGPMYRQLGDREWQVVEALEKVAEGLGKPMAQVAVNWVATQPGIASAVVGASSVAQLENTMTALDFAIPADARRELDEASGLTPPSPYTMFGDTFQQMVVGYGVGDRPDGYAPPVRTAGAA